MSGILTLALAFGGPANAEVVVNFFEQDGNVEAVASGSLNIDGLGAPDGFGSSSSFVLGSGFSSSFDGAFGVGIAGAAGQNDAYVINTDLEFCTGGRTTTFDDTGLRVGIASGRTLPDRLYVVPGYQSGTPIESTATFEGTTLAAMGMIPGTYVFSWGSGDNADQLTLIIGEAPPSDADGDGIPDTDEEAIGSNPVDADTDDDGLADGDEPGDDLFADSDFDGTINILDRDSDNDGLPDGLEAGVTTPVPGGEGFLGTDLSRWSPDLDPQCVTDPVNPDSDSDGLLDGDEDTNGNGRQDPGETDPCVNESLLGDDVFKDGFETP